MLALTQTACEKYSNTVKENGILLVDASVTVPEGIHLGKIVKVPVLETASNVIGKPMVANIVAIGIIQELLQTVSKESLEAAVLSRVPKGTEELNRRALEEGYKLARV